jgi:hypothetical protein
MKHRFFICIVFLLITSLNIFAADALILKLEGEVELQRNGESIVPKIGTSIFFGDVLIGKEGSATLLLSNGEHLSLYSDSRLEFKAPRKALSGTLGRLWNIVKEKISGSSKVEAYAGRVATIRGPKEVLRDFPVSGETEAELNSMLLQLESNSAEEAGKHLMRGCLYEDFRQFAKAENEYLLLKEMQPENSTVLILLADLYIKSRAYVKAREIFKHPLMEK